ncbi:MAG: hypothetical protein LLG06_13510 [Desulfobacteraceae bacterium]|nr:hypothetical protein [Desulfobacteraceae bacterium]
MRKFMAIAVVLTMAFTFGMVIAHAQQADTNKDGAMKMMSRDCPMMTGADGAKCAMGEDGKCPMAADKCPMPSHHGSKTSSAPDHGAH